MTFKDEIIKRVNPVEYMEKHLNIRMYRSGSNVSCISPFSQDTRPSMTIKESEGGWLIRDWREPVPQCFKNIIDVTMAVTGLDFSDSMKKIAQDLKLDINIETRTPEQIEEDKRKYMEQQKIKETCKVAYDYYNECMKRPHNPALTYMEKRGYNLEKCEKYKIGHAPDTNESTFFDYMKKHNVSNERLYKAGLVGRDKNNPNRYYEKFRGRAMFGIPDGKGDIVAFSGRLLDDGKDQAKYVNTPTIEGVYEKGNMLYGEDTIKNIKNPIVVVCEGYMDAIAYREMFEKTGLSDRMTAVAVGTANLSDEQTRILSKSNIGGVLLSLDTDKAGIKGTLSTIKKLESRNAKFMIMNTNKDYKDFDELWQSKKDDIISSQDAINIISDNEAPDVFVINEIKKSKDYINEFCDYVNELPIDRKYVYLESFKNELSDISPMQTVLLASSLGINERYIPYLLSNQSIERENPIKFAKDLELESSNIKITIPAFEKSYDFSDITLEAKDHVSSMDIISLLDSIDDISIKEFSKNLDSSKFNMYLENEKLILTDKTNINNTAEISCKDVDMIGLLKTSPQNMKDVFDFINLNSLEKIQGITINTDNRQIDIDNLSKNLENYVDSGKIKITTPDSVKEYNVINGKIDEDKDTVKNFKKPIEKENI